MCMSVCLCVCMFVCVCVCAREGGGGVTSVTGSKPSPSGYVVV